MAARARRARGIPLALALVAGVVASTVVAVSPASARVGSSATLTVPTGASVGSTSLNGAITMTNQNTAPNQAESNTVSEIKFAPSCGTGTTGTVACPMPDPGVFSINPTAPGEVGTACAGQVFSVSGPDASGVFTFSPTIGSVVLAPPGGPGSSSCTIDFLLNVLKVPTIDASVAPAVQTFANLLVKETGNVTGLMPVAAVSQIVTVNKGVPGFVTQASPSVAVGGTVSDTATLTKTAGAAAVTGTVTFSVFGPGDPTCAGAPLAQSTVVVAADGTAHSSPVTAAQAGVYRFVASYSGDANYVPLTPACNAAGESVTVTAFPRRPPADFDGDGKTDVSVFRPGSSIWYIHGSGGVDTATNFGTSGDIPVPANYDNNATTDIAVFRPSTGTWIIQGSPAVNWGGAGDIPVPGDYDGNGTANVAVFRPSTGTWYIQGGASVVFGTNGDIPVPGDYDGNGTTDIAVFRPSTGTWYVRGGITVGFGTSGDIPVPGDYDGNGTTDIAVFRPSTGTWYVRNGITVAWATNGDIPVPGDYNGDGSIDTAVFRPSTGVWYVRAGATTNWGGAGDVPLPLPDAIRRFFFMPL